MQNLKYSILSEFRWVAKSLIMAGLVKRVLVQLSYAIGIAEPLNITIFAHGTSIISEADLHKVGRWAVSHTLMMDD